MASCANNIDMDDSSSDDSLDEEEVLRNFDQEAQEINLFSFIY